MPPRFAPPFTHMFWLDESYALIVIASSLLIYLKTRELYRLSSHRGIRYFGYTFLFFGLSFFFRLLFPMIKIFTDLSLFEFRPYFSFLMVYTGTMAVLSLLYSVLWKKITFISKDPLYLLNIISIIIAGITLLGRYRFYILTLQAVIFLAAILISYIDYAGLKDGKHGQLYLLYTLLLFSWIANVASHFAARLSFARGILLYAFSIALFLIILYRVLRITHVE